MTVTWRINPSQPSLSTIEQAARAIRSGSVVGIPTDTFYGLAAHPFQAEAVAKIFHLKQRPENKPILLLVRSMAQVEMLTERLPAAFERVAARFWPGPLTIVLKASPRVPEQITAGSGTVAVRLPGSVVTRLLIEAARTPLTGTSANRSGRPPARTAAEVREQFAGNLPFLLDGGPAQSALPSTLLDLTGEPKVLRPGATPAADVLSLC